MTISLSTLRTARKHSFFPGTLVPPRVLLRIIFVRVFLDILCLLSLLVLLTVQGAQVLVRPRSLRHWPWQRKHSQQLVHQGRVDQAKPLRNGLRQLQIPLSESLS
eukprot:937298-Rhodomonas_salina.1